MSELPLHVQVALALGWSNPYDPGNGKWIAKKPGDTVHSDVPTYDKRWCDGGYLIPNHVRSLSHHGEGWLASNADGELFAGATPLEAVCRLVAYKFKG